MYKENTKNEDGSFRKTEMSDYRILLELSNMNKNWFAMAMSFTGNDRSASEDIIQDTYVKLHRLGKLSKTINVFEDGSVKVNIGYMYLTIRSVSYDYLKSDGYRSGRLTNIPEDNGGVDKDTEATFNTIAINEQILKNFHDEDNAVEQNECFGSMIDKMNSIIDECEWFDKQVYKLYTESGKSMQALSDETNISKTSINQAVQRVKSAIREGLKDSYADYKNGEYGE